MKEKLFAAANLTDHMKIAWSQHESHITYFGKIVYIQRGLRSHK